MTVFRLLPCAKAANFSPKSTTPMRSSLSCTEDFLGTLPNTFALMFEVYSWGVTICRHWKGGDSNRDVYNKQLILSLGLSSILPYLVRMTGGSRETGCFTS